MTRPEPPEEIRARELLSRALGAHVSSHDDGSRDSMYDLSIHLPGGDEPVEVVTVQNPGYIRFSDALNRRERRLPAPVLRHQWMAGLRHSARVKNLDKVLVGELSKLEEKHELTGGFVPVPDVLARHGVYYLSVGDYAAGEVLFGEEGWSVPPEKCPRVLHDFVERTLAREPDVVAKLLSVPSGRRHAFIWLGLEANEPASGFLARRGEWPDLASGALDVDPGVTDVWVVSFEANARFMHWTEGVWTDQSEGRTLGVQASRLATQHWPHPLSPPKFVGG